MGRTHRTVYRTVYLHGQNTLHGVTVHVGILTNAKVAHGDARKAFRSAPLLSEQQMTDHVETEYVEVVAEKDVKEKQLSNGVRSIEQLDGEIAEC